MTGSALEVFTDFMTVTGPAFLKGPEDVINEAVKNTYTLPRFIEGKSMSDMLQGGNSIKDTIFFNDDSNYQHYKPNAEFTYRNPQVLTEWSIPWRFTKDEMTWTDHEVGLNTGELSEGARFHKYKTLKRTKEQNLWSGFMNGMEDDLWAAPDATTMEATSGTAPYSIPCFINEFSDGVSGAGHYSGWTTVQGIDPDPTAGEAKWNNRLQNYAQSPQVGWDLFPAFSKMFYQLRFDRLPKMGHLSDPTSVPNFIATSLTGIANYEDGLRQNQDLFVTSGRQDPSYNHPRFRGIDVVYIANLDTAAIFPTGSGGALSTELDTAGTTNAGPRYFWINGRYMLKVFHRERYFYKKAPFSPSRQPFTKIMIVDCWHNLVCRSRRRHGIVVPSADI